MIYGPSTFVKQVTVKRFCRERYRAGESTGLTGPNARPAAGVFSSGSDPETAIPAAVQNRNVSRASFRARVTLLAVILRIRK